MPLWRSPGGAENFGNGPDDGADTSKNNGLNATTSANDTPIADPLDDPEYLRRIAIKSGVRAAEDFEPYVTANVIAFRGAVERGRADSLTAALRAKELSDRDMLRYMGRENLEDYNAVFLIQLESWEAALKSGFGDDDSSSPYHALGIA